MSAQQLVKNVARRIPLIKFKHGLSETSHKAASNTNQSQTITNPQQQNQQKSSSPSIEFFQLPKKYQRKPITIDEMETINKGGF